MKVILLAAGLSSRLTVGNKLTLPLPNGTTVLERAIRTAGSFTQEVWVVTGHEANTTTAIAEANGAQPLHNPDYMQGQETSLRKALTTLPGPMLVCPADLYLLTADDYSLCERILEKAVSVNLIARNPAKGCKLPPIRRNEMKILSREDMQKVLIQAKEENYYELFLLEFATGLRLGELMALQWDDVNLTTGELRINKQANLAGSKLVISEPKTKAAVQEDLPIRPSVVSLRLRKILNHAGCEPVRFHDLRHTFATNALAHGMDIKTLSTILGHVSSATTLNTYSHVTDEMRQRAAVKIDQGIAKAEVQDTAAAQPERTMTTFQARKRWSREAS